MSPLLLLAKRVCTSSTVLACILRAYAVVYLKFIKNIILYCSLLFIELSLNIDIGLGELDRLNRLKKKRTVQVNIVKGHRQVVLLL
jgi:hypothetical protein